MKIKLRGKDGLSHDLGFCATYKGSIGTRKSVSFLESGLLRCGLTPCFFPNYSEVARIAAF